MASKDKNILKRIKSSSWAKGLLTTFVGSLLSISLTFGVNSCHDTFQQKADRHLAALMVLGNIETFARNLETWQKENHPTSVSHDETAAKIFSNNRNVEKCRQCHVHSKSRAAFFCYYQC